MLNFDSSLTDALTTHSTNAFWVLKLYYNDESSFYGVSDQDRVDGSDTYYGIVSSWGGLSQSLDFFNFTTSTMNMSVKLINTDNTIDGGRFSDLFSTKNFANRKWELFLNTDRAGTYDTSARMIGTGIISGDIGYDTKSISLKLLDKSSKYHKQLPTNVVDSTYPNAPEKNINKPIPMAYGDFYEKTDVGTIPTGKFDRFKHYYKSAFPAIITDKFDVGQASVEAYADNETMHTLDSENVYIYKNGQYATLIDTVDATSNNPRIEFSGAGCKAYFPLSSSGYTTSGTGSIDNPTNLPNGVFDTSNICELHTTSGNFFITNYAMPVINKMGEYVGITALTKFGTVTGTFGGLNKFLVGNVAYPAGTVVSNAELENSIASVFSGKTDSWEFEGVLPYKVLSASGDKDVEVLESGIVVEFDYESIESRTIIEIVENPSIEGADAIADTGFGGGAVQTVQENKTITRTGTKLIPSEIDYIYCSGKGRKYGSWISDGGRSVGYTTTDFIENPTFIIEDVLRTELVLTDTEIDESSFDTSGNSTNGYVGDIYNDAVADIKYAFSQYKFINSKDLISRLCKQILSWVFIGGDGKFKIKTLRRIGDYSSADKTIDFNDINLKSISRSSLGAVRNDITINYNHDYGQNQFISSKNTTDSTSQGTTVNGVSQALKLELDADTLDGTTATKLADAYMTIFKDRKILLSFDCLRPTYNDLEIGDIVKFSNWDSTIKLYGDAMGTDYYLISSISKKPNGCSVKAIKVS